MRSRNLYAFLVAFVSGLCCLAVMQVAHANTSQTSTVEGDRLLRTAALAIAGSIEAGTSFTAEGRERQGRTPVYIVMSGGVSLGSYEGGYASTIARYLRQYPDKFELKGVAGTSAGAINSIATALEYCRIDDPTGQRTSVPYDTWAPVSWDMLYDEALVTRSALLHHENLRAHGLEILDSGRYPVREDCDVIIAGAVTQNYTDVSTSDIDKISSLVEYLAIRVKGSPRNQIRYEVLPPDLSRTPNRLALRGAADGALDPEQVVSMLLASAAFPAAFPSVDLTVCSEVDARGACVRSTERTYLDGGVFNNVPVSALLPFIEQEKTPPLIILVDLDNHLIPKPTLTTSAPGMGQLAQSWLSFARARDYAAGWHELKEKGFDAFRAKQRYPAASEAVSSFAGFLDRSFRNIDHALGVHDALLDIPELLRIPPTAIPEIPIHRRDACVHRVLQGGEISEDCAELVTLSEWVTMRAIVASAESRCTDLNNITLSCQRLEMDNLRERLPKPTISERDQRQRARLAGQASSADFQAFLVELRMGDFTPEIGDDWMSRRGANRHRPEVLWSRQIEDALRKYAELQQPPTLPVQVAMDTLLSGAIPVLPRPSITGLANLHSLEMTANMPLSTSFHLSVGGDLEWGIRADRQRGWHIASMGPVARLSWLFTERQALFALFADVHGGILFGPVLDSIREPGALIPENRAASRPNAAIFLGVAPKATLFRRLTADVPIRVYWLCENSICTNIDNARPSFAISFRIGWTWTLAPERR